MKAVLYIEGTNAGAEFLKDYAEQTINFESLYKNIEINSPPLAHIKTEDTKTFTYQLIDVRFIDEYIFIHGYVTNDEEKSGGKALIRLKPV